MTPTPTAAPSRPAPRSPGAPGHRAPSSCPVCGERLAVTRLGCPGCGTEVSGERAGGFDPCAYCALGDADRDMLRVFLSSRGNMRELERFLGVSYPTARLRFAELLGRLGMAEAAAAAAPSREEVLARLAAGELDVDAAAALIAQT